ncbi:MAG: plasmid replication protein, CyRepA1 family [Cyanobacteria bacterium J06600_6]
MLFEKHNQEWLDSSVSQSIIDLNVVSLRDFEPYDRILYGIPDGDRRNDGRIRDKLLRRYQHLEEGGWWVSGKDILTGEDSPWGQFKPDTPYRYQEKSEKGFETNQYKNKLIKYETPKNVPTEIIALKVSFLDSWNIVQQYQEAAKNAWIERVQKNWLTLTKKENIQNVSTRKISSTARRCLSKSEMFDTKSGHADSQKSKQSKFFQELQEACSGRKYDQINQLVQSVQNCSKNNPEKSDNTYGIEIERLREIEDREFWSWLVHTPQIPVVLTEGGKKAGSIICAHYIAIALPGIYNGYRQPKDKWGNKAGSPHLIPQLELLAQGGREITFCFDRDTKPSTAKNVRTAIIKTGTLLQLQGASVNLISWNDPFKGVDDLISHRGVDYFRYLYQSRISLSNFKLKAALDISKYKPLLINQRYLSDSLVPTELAQLIGLKSPKNTGKTEWLSRIVRRLINKGKPVLIITHRIQLAKALCARFGVDHIEEVRNSETKGILGYGLCIDSLHPNSQAHFYPEDWSEAVVILDEAEQVIWHMLDSSTCQENRVEIIENFQALLKIVINSGGQIYLSDADLSCISLDYVISLIGSPIKTWVAENGFQSQNRRKLIPYIGNDPRDLIAALTKEIEAGGKVLVHTTGQKIKSKWGSINLESYCQEKFPLSKILRIDRDSVSEPGHPAYGCMGNLDRIINSYDIVIASPVIETGVSIDIKGHFNSVWAIAQGIQTVDAVCQTVERLRDAVPRHLWIKTTAKANRIGNGSTSVKALLRSQHKLTQANIRLLQQSSMNDFDDLEVDFSPTSFISWGKRACIVNAGKNNYRESILCKLLSEGYELHNHDEQNIVNANIIRQEVYQVCEKNYLNYCSSVSTASSVSDKELEELNNKKAKTKTERLSERKGNLEKRYGIEVTPELVKKDDNGWYPQLQLLYFLTVANKYLPERDCKFLAKISKNNKTFKPDINKKTLSAKIKALEIIQIQQFLNPEAEFSKDTLADWFEFVIELRFDIKTLLGVSINPEKDSAIAVAQRILKKLGLKLEFQCWRGDRKNKQRIYSGCNLGIGSSSKIFNYWLSRDTTALEAA